MERKINVDPGAFPFPLIEGPEESRYLTWVRNHSNYLAEGGFVDYMRILAILVRGIVVNFLTLLPYLLLGALLLGLLYNPMLDDWQAQVEEASLAAVESTEGEPEPEGEAGSAEPVDYFLVREVRPNGAPAPDAWWNRVGAWVWKAQSCLHTKPPFLLTPLVVLAAAIHFFLFPVVIRLFKVMGAKRSLETGSDSSVKLRDEYERTFGGALIAILAVALFESLPLLAHHFHQWQGVGWRNAASAVVGGTAVMALSGAGKLVSIPGVVKRRIALALVGLLGLALPLLVVLFVTEFLVYAPPMDDFDVSPWVLAAIPALLAFGVVTALVVGWGKISRRESLWLSSLLLPILATVVLMALLAPAVPGRWFFVLVMALEIWLFCWLAVDVNLTSVLGLYRDRLASAYLVGEDTSGDVDIEEDVDLHDICRYEAMSTAPYYLINAAHNLQHSADISIRERNSDFFLFSKRFVGGERTGYCRSESLERVFPQMDLATAMAISAAAAAPNMGKNTSRGLVALLTILNIRLGYWIPNPGRLAGRLAAALLAQPAGSTKRATLERWWEATGTAGDFDEAAATARLRAMAEAADRSAAERLRSRDLGFRFDEVFRVELGEVRRRWDNVYRDRPAARPRLDATHPTPDHGLVGLGFSGGGIRSATLNLGIAQALHRAGVFTHVDYLSSVSGGGYLGSSLTTLMRARTRLHSEITGAARVVRTADQVEVEVSDGDDRRTYVFHPEVELSPEVEAGRVERGTPLTRHFVRRAGLRERFAWRVRPQALGRELLSRVDEVGRWVNLSDGGHIENLAAVELLRRRCRFIVLGDGAADPLMRFGPLATLIRYARIDFGIDIQIDPQDLRLRGDDAGVQRSSEHFAVGRIRYPKASGGFEATEGRLLYLKASLSGDEDEVVEQYRATHAAFPHESTADQFFDEGQFEAYRALGQHIAETALGHAPGSGRDVFATWLAGGRTVDQFFEDWFAALAARGAAPTASELPRGGG